MEFQKTIKSIEEDLKCRWQEKILAEIEKISKDIIVVFWWSQNLTYYKNWQKQYESKVATGKNGFWNEIWSHKTPIWLHRICDFIWDGCDEKQIFKAREKTDVLQYYPSKPNVYPVILSRILQLEGMEPEYNENTKKRCIYIHWTPQTRYFETKDLKRTFGCITLPPSEIIKLFNKIDKNNVWEGPYVYIFEKNKYQKSSNEDEFFKYATDSRV